MRWLVRSILAFISVAATPPGTALRSVALSAAGPTDLDAKVDSTSRGLKALVALASSDPGRLAALLPKGELMAALGLDVSAAPHATFFDSDALAVMMASAADRSRVASTATEHISSTAAVVFRSGQDPEKETKEEGKKNQQTTLAKMVDLDLDDYSTRKMGWSLWIIAATALMAAVIFELVHRRWANCDLNIELSYGGETHENQLRRIFTGVLPLARPYFDETRRAWKYLCVLACFGLCILFLGVIYIIWRKDFWDTMERKDEPRFRLLILDYLVLVSCMLFVFVYAIYIGMMMIIDWRQYMTKWLLDRWFQSKYYYRLQLEADEAKPDNPDQRIQEDVNLFIPTLVTLSAGFFNAIGELITRLPIVIFMAPNYAFGRYYCPGWLLYFAIAYSGFGTLMAHLIGGKLILINFAKQKYEANFRYGIVQVRDNAESIALYSSEFCECKRLQDKFEWIIRAWWHLMIYKKRLSFFTTFYFVTSYTFPYIVLAPSYFKGDITLGTLMVLIGALADVKGAFDWIISSYLTLADFRATVDRLTNFVALCKEIADDSGEDGVKQLTMLPKSAPESTAVLAADMRVSLPKRAGSRVLWDAAGITVQSGQFVLLSAQEGSGKSCFFRALAGIWPYASGHVYLKQNALFLPQCPYCPQGSLKQAVTYPQMPDQFGDAEVREALSKVGLSVVGSRSLDEEANWSVELSGGERQRLAIARAVLRRPSVLFMDESTSAMGNDDALMIYRLLRQDGTLPKGAAVISISHDISLLAAEHDIHYEYEQESACWRIAGEGVQ